MILNLSKSQIKPRHVLCFLGKECSLKPLSDAAFDAIGEFATGFTCDSTYSRSKPDEGMVESFDVCWDRVRPAAWSKMDEEAVENHKSVLYVLGPPMDQDNSVLISGTALLLVNRLIDAGAVAVKGESAGVAHGSARWKELALKGISEMRAGDDFKLQRTCRLAFAKRPIIGDGHFESIGFHLVGLPEVFVPEANGDVWQAIDTMAAVADEIAQNGLDVTLRERRATLSSFSSYEEDEFKFNPYGSVMLAKDLMN